MRLAFRAGEGNKAVAWEVGTGSPGYIFNEYVDVPAGRGVFELFAEQDKQAVASLSAELGQKFYATVLLSEPAKAGEPPRMELIDAGDAGPATPAQVSVRNFVAELKDVHVSFGEKLSAQFDAGLGYLLMRGITPASYRVQTTGTLASGEPFEWTTEVDLRQNRRQTLLIYPDPYGRIRPRISIDGEASATVPEKQNGQR